MIKKTGFWKRRLFLALTTMTLFLACQKDDDSSSTVEVDQTTSQSKTTTRKISADNIPDIMQYIPQKVIVADSLLFPDKTMILDQTNLI